MQNRTLKESGKQRECLLRSRKEKNWRQRAKRTVPAGNRTWVWGVVYNSNSDLHRILFENTAYIPYRILPIKILIRIWPTLQMCDSSSPFCDPSHSGGWRGGNGRAVRSSAWPRPHLACSQCKVSEAAVRHCCPSLSNSRERAFGLSHCIAAAHDAMEVHYCIVLFIPLLLNILSLCQTTKSLCN
jgi:hypothetical protein